jgi:phospholipid transport system substrate-binding protein
MRAPDNITPQEVTVERPAFRALWTIVLLLGLLPLSGADTTPSPKNLVEDTTEKMVGALKAQRATLRQHPERLYGLVESIVLPHFDFERMSRLVLGRYWRSATPEQRQRFVPEFRNLLVRTYASTLLDYADQKITVGPDRAEPGATDVTVHSNVEQPGAAPIAIDYRMALKGSEWKVYDVMVDGVSLVTNYRSSFATEIQRKGLDQLIDTLASRNREGRKYGEGRT